MLWKTAIRANYFDVYDKMGSDQNYDLRTLMKPDAKAIESITNNETVMIWKKIVGEKAIGVENKPAIHGSHMLIMLL